MKNPYGALFCANLKSALGFRSSFFVRIAFMALNNLIFFSTWIILFNRMGSLGDWHLRDMSLLWGINATAFGLANGFFGGIKMLPEFVRTGALDCYLLKPCNLLLQVITARSEPAAWGDCLSGMLFLVLSGYLSVTTLPVVLFATFCAAVVYVATCLIFYSIAFWEPNCDDISLRFYELMIAFSSYPESIFSSSIKIFLYTILPAAFISFLPVAVVRDLNISDLLLLGGGSLFISLISISVFYYGLKRYESGNRWSMHGV